MKYPKLLQKGDTIGVCAPSSGVSGETLSVRLDNAIRNIKALGYDVIETASVRCDDKCVSASSEIRVAEFMNLYETPNVAAILPPWGGEFLMDMLPHLDFEKLAAIPAKWVCGYSDMSTLTFTLTLNSDIATIHGSNLMNMGYARIHDSDMRAFDVMSNRTTEQKSWDTWGGFSSWDDFTGEVYNLDKPSTWKSLQGDERVSFDGMMIGGCLEIPCARCSVLDLLQLNRSWISINGMVLYGRLKAAKWKPRIFTGHFGKCGSAGGSSIVTGLFLVVLTDIKTNAILR